MNKLAMAVLMAGLIVGTGIEARASRIKDIAQIEGVKSEMVVGYGLVVGLNGTGDGNKAIFTGLSLENMLERFGITISADEIKVANVAAVMVTAEVDPFMRLGGRIDVTCNSVGDASSLEGGTLLATPLLGLDGSVYAIAQGSISIGGFNISGGAGNSVRQNHATVGRIVGGGTVQRSIEQPFIQNAEFNVSVRDFDFSTVSSMVGAINETFGRGTAEGLDGRTVRVRIPTQRRTDPVGFIGELQQLPVVVDAAARVVINEKTGTVVVGANVEVGEAGIAHGTLKVEIRTRYDVSQAAPFGDGETVVVPDVETIVQDNEARIFAFNESSTVGTIAEALNEIGVTPRDIIAIFQALKRAGALRAELVVI